MEGRMSDCPSDRCFGCWYYQPRMGGHDPAFMDLRTGRRFCHECMAALVTWELDGEPEPDESAYPDWLNTSCKKVSGNLA